MPPQEKSSKSKLIHWQLPLAVVFLCFGFLITAQYRTHKAYSNSLETQSYTNLSTLALGLMDGRSQLQAEVTELQRELDELEADFNSGIDLTTYTETRINTLQTAIGAYVVSGPGISLTITSESSPLIAYDLMDIVNELFVSGAEAVSINNQRVTAHTQIADVDIGYGNFNITIDGKTLLSPVVIRAIGDPSTLETGLIYPNGIVDNLRFQRIFPIVKQEESVSIPAARFSVPEYASLPPKAE